MSNKILEIINRKNDLLSSKDRSNSPKDQNVLLVNDGALDKQSIEKRMKNMSQVPPIDRKGRIGLTRVKIFGE